MREKARDWGCWGGWGDLALSLAEGASWRCVCVCMRVCGRVRCRCIAAQQCQCTHCEGFVSADLSVSVQNSLRQVCPAV